MSLLLFFLLTMCFSLSAMAGAITKNFTFSSGQTASSASVNSNFDQLFTEMNLKETRVTNLEASAWGLSGGNLNFTTGKVGVGTSTPKTLAEFIGTPGWTPIAAIAQNMTDSNTAPAVAANAYYLGIGQNEYGANSFRMIGFGYNNALGGQYPAFVGYQEITSAGSTNGDLIFGTRSVTTATAPVERMRINAAGSVGIGTASPSSPLTVSGLIESTSGGIKFPDGTIQATAAAASGTNNTLISGWPDVIVCNVPGWGKIEYFAQALPDSSGYYDYGSTVANGWQVQFNSDGTFSWDNVSGDCETSISSLYSAGQAFNLIKGPVAQWLSGSSSSAYYNAGNVGVGTNAPGYKLEVNGDINIESTYALRFAGTSVCTSTGCTASSDRTLKEHIRPLQDSLDKVLKLQGVEYDYKDKVKFTDKHQVGVIAQDVEKIYPEVVNTDSKTGLKAVAYDHLIAPLIEAFKTLYSRVLGVEGHQVIQDRAIASIKAENADLTADKVIKDKEIAELKAKVAMTDKRANKLERENTEMKTRLENIEKELASKNSRK